MKKIKKKYHLRKEIKEFFSDAFLDILGILVLIGIILGFMMINTLLFG